MPIDLAHELQFRTARSGGAGGQHVNKVETKVVAFWHIASSRQLNEDQKGIVMRKLANLINKNDELMLSSQIHRTQLANKESNKKRSPLRLKQVEKKSEEKIYEENWKYILSDSDNFDVLLY